MSVKWKGAAVLRATRRAQVRGINVIMSRCVQGAKTAHEWINRTGILEGSIGIHIFARASGGGIAGEWGSADVVYARVHELGSAKMNIPARPYLRPQADIHYPNLPTEIRRAMA